MMKRTLPLFVALCLTLSACGGKEEQNASDKTPQELTAAYTQAITAAQDAEEQEAFPLLDPADSDTTELILPSMGIDPAEDVTAYAVAASMRGIQAYNIAAFMPAPDKSDTVVEALEGYIDTQKQTFHRYLEDQYDIAASAKLETLSDGTVLLVMCPDQDAALATIKSALEA